MQLLGTIFTGGLIHITLVTRISTCWFDSDVFPPNRWLDYKAVGKRLRGTRFIAFKVPLKQVRSHSRTRISLILTDFENRLL